MKEEEHQEKDVCAQETDEEKEEKLKTDREERQGETQRGGGGGYTQQPVLLPFCMNVNIKSSKFFPAYRKLAVQLLHLSFFPSPSCRCVTSAVCLRAVGSVRPCLTLM